MTDATVIDKGLSTIKPEADGTGLLRRSGQTTKNFSNGCQNPMRWL